MVIRSLGQEKKKTKNKQMKKVLRAAANHIAADNLNQYTAHKSTASACCEIQTQHLTLSDTHLCVSETGGLCVFVCLCVCVCVGDLLVSAVACVVLPLQTAAAAAMHCAAWR